MLIKAKEKKKQGRICARKGVVKEGFTEKLTFEYRLNEEREKTIQVSNAF